MRNGLQRSLKAGPSGKRNPFLLKSANVSPMCLCFSCKYLVSATSLLITLFSSRFVDPLTSLISLRVAQRNRMEFKPKLFASGVPTSWCPNVSGSRCLGVSVFQVVSRCTVVSGVFTTCFQTVFSILAYRLLWVRAVLVQFVWIWFCHCLCNACRKFAPLPACSGRCTTLHRPVQVLGELG